MFERSRPAAGDDRNRNRIGDGAREFEVEAFAGADELDRHTQLFRNRKDDAALRGAVELGHDQARDADGLVELLRLRERVLALARVEHEQHLVRRTVDLLASRPEIDPERIGITGISLGGIVAVTAAESEPPSVASKFPPVTWPEHSSKCPTADGTAAARRAPMAGHNSRANSANPASLEADAISAADGAGAP